MMLILLLGICIIIILYSYQRYGSEHFNIEPFTSGELSLSPSWLIKGTYKMLYFTIKILRGAGIIMWAEGGTLLGCVRHKGMIPWDDDADICIWAKDEKKLLSLKGEFCKHGYQLVKWPPINGHYWGYRVLKKGTNKLVPSVDIFLCHRIGDIVRYSHTKRWAKTHYKYSDLFPLKEWDIGSYKLMGAHNPKPYLDNEYGSDWATNRYKEFDHVVQKFVRTQKERIPKNLFYPAEPFYPNPNSKKV